MNKNLSVFALAGALATLSAACNVTVDGPVSPYYTGGLTIAIDPFVGGQENGIWTSAYDPIVNKEYKAYCYNHSFYTPSVTIEGDKDNRCSHPLFADGVDFYNNVSEYETFNTLDRMVYSFAQYSDDYYVNNFMTCELYNNFDNYVGTIDDAIPFFVSGFIIEADCDGLYTASSALSSEGAAATQAAPIKNIRSADFSKSFRAGAKASFETMEAARASHAAQSDRKIVVRSIEQRVQQ